MRILILLLLLTACEGPRVHFLKYSKEIYDPYKGNVRIFNVLPKNKKYVVIGDVEAEAFLATPNEQVIQALKREAAENGANAIVLEEEGIITHMQFSLKNILGLYKAPKTGSAVAIRVE